MKTNTLEIKNAYLDGTYELERQTMFFARRDCDDCLMSPSMMFHTGQECRPVKFTGQALLVSATQSNQLWYAWIH